MDLLSNCNYIIKSKSKQASVMHAAIFFYEHKATFIEHLPPTGTSHTIDTITTVHTFVPSLSSYHILNHELLHPTSQHCLWTLNI